MSGLETQRGARIRSARERSGLSQAGLAKLIGVSRGIVSRWEQGHYEPRRRTLDKLAVVLKTSTVELMGEDAYGATTTALLEDEPLRDNVGLPFPPMRAAGRIPRIPWNLVGVWMESENKNMTEIAWVDTVFAHSAKAFCVPIEDESMVPDYRKGETIQVEPEAEATNAKDVVVMMPDGGLVFRRLQVAADGRYLVALNPHWPERIFKIPSDARIIGVVKYSWMQRG